MTDQAVRPARGRVWPIAVLASRANIRQPMVYLTLAAMPLSYFLVFTMVAGRELGQHAFIGAAIAFTVTGGVVSLPQTVVLYRMRKIHHMVVASPIKPLTYFLGLSVSRLVYIAPPVLVVLTVFAFLGDRPLWRIVALLPALLLAWMFGCSVGFAISRRWDNPAYIASTANMIGYLLVLLPPVYYPMAMLPEWLQMPISVIPTASLAELMRAMAGLSDPSLMGWIGYSAVVLAVIGACVWYTSGDERWREP